MVNLSSIKEGVFHDDTCEVQPGEHPFVTRPSFAVYRSAVVERAERLTKMVDGWVYKAHEDASNELTERIYAGIMASRFTPNHVKAYVRALD